MTYWYFYWLLLLVLSASLVSWLSLGSSLVKISETHVFDLLKIVSLSLVFPYLGKITRILGAVGLGLVVGIPLGRTIESNARDSNTYERYGVTILEKNSPRVYQMHEAEAGTYQAVFCEDENFDKGERLKLIRYLDKGTCWQLQGKKLGFIYAKGDSNHEGWNTDSHANAYAYAFTFAQAR